MAEDNSESSKTQKNKDPKDNKESNEEGLSIGETFKKVLTAGFTAAFLTEESIRSYLSEVKLPKEILQLLIQGASKSKEDLTQKVSKEVASILGKIDFVKEFSRFAENHKFKISAEVEILKKDSEKNP